MKKSLLALALVAACAVAQAAPISYNVNRSIGPGSVTGTLITDGTIGILSTSNILSWSFQIDDGDGNGAFQITNLNAALLLAGNLLSGDADSLDFNFGGSSGFALFQYPFPGSSQNWWCVEGVDSHCAGTGAGETTNRFGGPVYQSYNTSVEIGSVDNHQDLPEPGSLALVGLALLGLTGARRYKQG